MVELRKATFFDYIRFILSSLLLIFSIIVTSYAIVERKTLFWKIVPGWAGLLIFIVDLIILGIVEGLQIALVELKRQHPESYKKSHPAAYKLGQISSKGENVERFLMGRQVFVVLLVFFAAKLTTIHLAPGENFLFPAPYWFRAVFLETGILACIVVVIIAQLMPQIVAAKYPVHFLQFLIMRPAYYVCIFVETTGLTHACWLLSSFMEYLSGMKDDETTVNPNDLETAAHALENIESSLSSRENSDSEDENMESQIYLTKHERKMSLDYPNKKEPFSKFTHLVQKINDQVNPDTLHLLRHYLDSHPEKFHKFPSVVGSRVYPPPYDIAEEMDQQGHEVPKFLTDISDPQHVPPHIVACELLAENRRLQDHVSQLEAKLNCV